MKWKKIASLLLITALFLSFLGGCQEIQPFFAKAKKKMDTIYALMIQILGDGQYTNDDMANLTALKTAAGVFAESYQFGLGLLEQALDR